jgi:hypothetical protein
MRFDHPRCRFDAAVSHLFQGEAWHHPFPGERWEWSFQLERSGIAIRLLLSKDHSAGTEQPLPSLFCVAAHGQWLEYPLFCACSFRYNEFERKHQIEAS